MDFRTLQYFVTVAQELNFTRAAEKLHMSQPPLSTQIRDLEEDLGVELFIRGKRSLQLTEAGHMMLRRSMQMLELSDKTRQEMASFGAELTGRVCIATVDGCAPFLAAEWIKGFREEYPNVEFSVWNGSSDDVIHRLARGLADVGIIISPYDTEHLEGIPVWQEPWVALMSEDHPYASLPGDQISLELLAEQPLIGPQRISRQEAISRWFSEIGKEPDIFCSLSNYMDAAALAKQGAGICIYPQTSTETWPGIISKVIVDPPKMAEYVLIHFRDQKPHGAALQFHNYIKDWLETQKPLTDAAERL